MRALNERGVPLRPTFGEENRCCRIGARQGRSELDEQFRALGKSLESAMERSMGNLRLDEIEVALEVGTDGSIGIPGIGMKVTGKSSITLRFSRRSVLAT